MSQTMKAILVKEANKDSADALYLGEAPKPSPKSDELLIKVKAFGLNRMDIMQRKGRYPLPPGASSILGVEFSGTVEAAGHGFKENEEVFGLTTGVSYEEGAYSEYVAVKPRLLSRKPASMSWSQAAAIPENWLTAFQCIFLVGQFKKGDSILVHAGASGVGTSAIQLARAFGAKHVFATAGTADKTKFLEEKMKATKAFNYKTEDWAEGVLKATDGAGVNVILDFVGPNYWEPNLKAIARDGRLVLIGLLSGTTTAKPVDLSPLLFKRLRIEGTTLRSRSLEYQEDLMQQFSKEALPKIVGRCDGTHHGDLGMDLVIHEVFDAKDVVKATKCMEEAQNTGKLICEWRD